MYSVRKERKTIFSLNVIKQKVVSAPSSSGLFVLVLGTVKEKEP